jgi:hypothetical protein
MPGAFEIISDSLVAQAQRQNMRARDAFHFHRYPIGFDLQAFDFDFLPIRESDHAFLPRGKISGIDPGFRMGCSDDGPDHQLIHHSGVPGAAARGSGLGVAPGGIWKKWILQMGFVSKNYLRKQKPVLAFRIGSGGGSIQFRGGGFPGRGRGGWSWLAATHQEHCQQQKQDATNCPLDICELQWVHGHACYGVLPGRKSRTMNIEKTSFSLSSGLLEAISWRSTGRVWPPPTPGVATGLTCKLWMLM